MKTTTIMLLSVVIFSIVPKLEVFSQSNGTDQDSNEEKAVPSYTMQIPEFSVEEILQLSDVKEDSTPQMQILPFTPYQILGLTEFDAPEEFIYEPLPGLTFNLPEEELMETNDSSWHDNL